MKPLHSTPLSIWPNLQFISDFMILMMRCSVVSDGFFFQARLEDWWHLAAGWDHSQQTQHMHHERTWKEMIGTALERTALVLRLFAIPRAVPEETLKV